jgi:hypothetical protein
MKVTCEQIFSSSLANRDVLERYRQGDTVYFARTIWRRHSKMQADSQDLDDACARKL